MKKMLFLLLACLLLAFPCEAREAYWQNHSSQALRYGARGIIVPDGAGDTAKDAACLTAANAKAPFITWSIASGVNSSMSPQSIAAALGGSGDFFVIASVRELPEVCEYFPAQDVYYTEHEWLDVTVDRTDDKGRSKDHYSFKEYDRSFERVAHFGEKEIKLCPSLVSFNIYDNNATEIFNSVEMAWPSDYQRSHAQAAESFFGNTLNAFLSGKPSKVEKQKVKGVEWVDSNGALKGKNRLSVAVPQITEPLISEVDNYRRIFQQAAFTELSEKKKLLVTYDENAPLRVEILVQQYHDNFYRREPRVSTWDRSDTNYNYRKHRGDNYQDTFKEERHWTEARMVEGSVAYSVTLGVIIKVVDTASGKPVYTYSVNTSEADRKYDGYVSIMRDFAKKLQKKLGGSND